MDFRFTIFPNISHKRLEHPINLAFKFSVYGIYSTRQWIVNRCTRIFDPRNLDKVLISPSPETERVVLNHSPLNYVQKFLIPLWRHSRKPHWLNRWRLFCQQLFFNAVVRFGLCTDFWSRQPLLRRHYQPPTTFSSLISPNLRQPSLSTPHPWPYAPIINPAWPALWCGQLFIHPTNRCRPWRDFCSHLPSLCHHRPPAQLMSSLPTLQSWRALLSTMHSGANEPITSPA